VWRHAGRNRHHLYKHNWNWYLSGLTIDVKYGVSDTAGLSVAWHAAVKHCDPDTVVLVIIVLGAAEMVFFLFPSMINSDISSTFYQGTLVWLRFADLGRVGLELLTKFILWHLFAGLLRNDRNGFGDGCVLVRHERTHGRTNQSVNQSVNERVNI